MDKVSIAALATLALASLRNALGRIFMAVIGPKIVEWAVLKALEWLAQQTKSAVDDELVAKVKEALNGSTSQ